jgi:1,2-diacylglycerol 3-beta-galactosyltransferase
MPTLDFVFFDAGGGHRAAATALKAVIEQQQRPWKVRLVNLQEVLEPLDVFKKVTGLRLEDIYNKMLEKGWTLGSAQGLRFMQAVIRWNHDSAARVLAEHWRQTKPDVVVSLVPNLNREMFDGLRQAHPNTPYVTVITDLADYPPHFWMEQQDQYMVCGTRRAVDQAHQMGYRAGRIFATSGMIIRPKFYETVTVDRTVERQRLGLDPAKPTGIVLFGGQGSPVMREIAQQISDSALEVQLIFVCGRNEKLAQRLRGLKLRMPVHVEGFTTEIPYFMHLSDFFIGKPGPGSISEALHMKLPVIVERNAWTLPQERFNADWVLEQGVGFVLPNFRRIASAVSELNSGGTLARMRTNAAQINNQAVFEITEFLGRVLDEAGAESPTTAPA